MFGLPRPAFAAVVMLCIAGCGSENAVPAGALPGEPRTIVPEYEYPKAEPLANALSDVEPPVEPPPGVEALQSRVEELEARNAQLMRALIADLQRENAALRQELRRTRRGGDAPAREPGEPGELAPLEAAAALPEPVVAVAGDAEAGASEASPADAPGEPEVPESGRLEPRSGVYYETVAAWGGAAEDAPAPPESPSAGLICAVAPDTSDALLADFARAMRERYARHRRITVEVFDGMDAARAYYEENASPEGHRLLLVHRNAETGQDVIVRFREEGEELLPLAVDG